jgi:hypothetical protein
MWFQRHIAEDRPMKRLAAVALALQLAGCGGTANPLTATTRVDSAGANTLAAVTPASLVGTWKGSEQRVTDVDDGTVTLTVTAVAADGSLTGDVIWTSAKTSKSYSGYVSGPMSGVTVPVEGTANQCRVSAAILAVNPERSIAGIWSIAGTCAPLTVGGVFSLQRVP